MCNSIVRWVFAFSFHHLAFTRTSRWTRPLLVKTMVGLLTTELVLISDSLKPLGFCVLTDRVKEFKHAIFCCKPWGRRGKKEWMFQSYYMVTIAGKKSITAERIWRKHAGSHPSIWNVVWVFFLSISSPTSLQKCLFSYIRIWPEESYWLANTVRDKDLSWYCMVSPPVHSHLSEIKIKSFTDCYFCLSHQVWLHWTYHQRKQTMMQLYQEHCISWTDSHPQKKNCRTDLGN